MCRTGSAVSNQPRMFVLLLEQVHLYDILYDIFILLVPNTEANYSSVLRPPNCIFFLISSC